MVSYRSMGTTETKKRQGVALTAALCAVTLLLIWAAFPPADLGFLAWVGLVPWLVLVGNRRPLRAAAWSLALGWAFFLLTIHWIRLVSEEAWIGWIALSFYCGLYWCVAGWGIAWLRTRRVPVLLSAPLLIVALELLRSRLLTGFPFILLGHTQHRFLPVIQIADITGVYGVSFLVVLVNAMLAEAVLSWKQRPRLVRAGALATLLLVAIALLYGVTRLGDYAPRDEVTALLVQANIPQSVKHSNSREDCEAIIDEHVRLTLQENARADIVIWPETMFPVPLDLVLDSKLIDRLLSYSAPDLPPGQREAIEKKARDDGAFLRSCRDRLFETGGPMLIGAEYADPNSKKRYNSAFLKENARLSGRYDKIHLVIFGEYTPLAKELPFLKAFRPPEMGQDLSPGTQRTIFSFFPQSRSNDTLPLPHSVRFGAVICYEDTDADLFRRFVRDGAQFMATLTNDGWFGDSSELDQHLAASKFRAVENRVSLVRSANTGISAVIDPVGHTQVLESPDGRRREVKGTMLATVPLSNMRGKYTNAGDIFGFAVLICAGLLLFSMAFKRPATADSAA